MKLKLLSGLLVSSALLGSGAASAQQSTTSTAITDPAKISGVATKSAPAADTGSATKTKPQNKKPAAPAVSKPQTEIESHQHS